MIPLRRRTKNHLGSMYFGALAVGADLAGGLLAMTKAVEMKKNLGLVFKGFSADFLSRATGDVYFTCNEGKKIMDTIRETLESQERINVPLQIEATIPSVDDEPVARFEIVLSLKYKPKLS